MSFQVSGQAQTSTMEVSVDFLVIGQQGISSGKGAF